MLFADVPVLPTRRNGYIFDFDNYIRGFVSEKKFLSFLFSLIFFDEIRRNLHNQI